MPHFAKPAEGSWTEHYPELGTGPVPGFGRISWAAVADPSTMSVVSDGDAMSRPVSAATAVLPPLRRNRAAVTTAFTTSTATSASRSVRRDRRRFGFGVMDGRFL